MQNYITASLRVMRYNYVMKPIIELVKIVVIIIKDESGNFFVHQRNSIKTTFPNMFGLGAGGHIEKGETKEKAAIRELFEETRLKSNVKYLFSIDYKDNKTNNIVDVFETTINRIDIKMDHEWQWCGWLGKDKLDELLSNNKLCPDTAKIYKKYIIIKL